MPTSSNPLVSRVVYGIAEGSKAHVRRALKRRELVALRVRESLRDAQYVAVLVVKNEAPRFPFLLDYYRRIGVEHFIVIDNGSDDGLDDLLRPEPDVSVYRANGQYGRARYGNDWVNIVLGRHAVGKWVLYVDADEFLVTAGGRTVPELCSALERGGRASLQAMMLDMYSEARPEENVVAPHQDPLEVCRLYDRDGYIRRFDHRSGVHWIKGGVRGRVFFEDDPWLGPALNKTPLVKWRAHHAFLKSAHELWPRPLNGDSARVDAALLHFKFTATSAERIVDSTNTAQHTAEYGAYAGVASLTLTGPPTGTYTGPEDLVRDRLISPAL